MKRSVKYIERVGNFISNGVGKYKIDPQCNCGLDHAIIDDYTRGEVKCFNCEEVLFENFEEVYP